MKRVEMRPNDLTPMQTTEIRKRAAFFFHWLKQFQSQFPEITSREGNAYCGFVAGVWYTRNQSRIRDDGTMIEVIDLDDLNAQVSQAGQEKGKGG